MAKFLIAESIYLRPLELTDANSEYLSWLNNHEVTTGLASGAFPTTLAQLQEYAASKSIDKNTVILAICDSNTNQHIGNIKLDNFDWISATCELGLLIGNKNFWNKNVGFDACSLVVSYAFEKLNMRKILLAVYSNNTNAISLYEKLGFENEGILKNHVYINGHYFDKHYMSIFNHNFKR